MRFSALALAYDGMVANEGVLDPEVRQAIREVRAHGVTVVIVTRRLSMTCGRAWRDLWLRCAGWGATRPRWVLRRAR